MFDYIWFKVRYTTEYKCKSVIVKGLSRCTYLYHFLLFGTSATPEFPLNCCAALGHKHRKNPWTCSYATPPQVCYKVTTVYPLSIRIIRILRAICTPLFKLNSRYKINVVFKNGRTAVTLCRIQNYINVLLDVIVSSKNI